MITEYKILEAYDAERLRVKVQEAINENWNPYGDLIVIVLRDGASVYTQAMAKYDNTIV